MNENDWVKSSMDYVVECPKLGQTTFQQNNNTNAHLS